MARLSATASGEGRDSPATFERWVVRGGKVVSSSLTSLLLIGDPAITAGKGDPLKRQRQKCPSNGHFLHVAVCLLFVC
jgi:hypothetical protein